MFCLCRYVDRYEYLPRQDNSVIGEVYITVPLCDLMSIGVKLRDVQSVWYRSVKQLMCSMLFVLRSFTRKECSVTALPLVFT